MPKSIKSWGPSDPIPRAGLTPFPSLKKWEDPWEAGLDLVKLRGNAAKFQTIRQLSETPRPGRGEPLPVVAADQIDKLIAPLELDDAASAVLRSDARLIAAWYELPRHQERICAGKTALLEALDNAANPVRNLYDQLFPFQHGIENLLEELPLTVVGSQRDFDVVGLVRSAVEFSSLVDRILEYVRPHNRRYDSRRNVAIALTAWAAENATGVPVRTSRGTRTEVNWCFTTSSGKFVLEFMKLLGWPNERVIVGAFDKLKRSPSVTDRTSDPAPCCTP